MVEKVERPSPIISPKKDFENKDLSSNKITKDGGDSGDDMSDSFSSDDEMKLIDAEGPLSPLMKLNSTNLQSMQTMNCMIDVRDNDLKAEVAANNHICSKVVTKVLLIVTGGTLCMVQSENGYIPSKGLADRLKTYKCFHDHEHAKTLELDDNTLITPPSPFKNRVQFSVLEFDNLIDSSCICLDDQKNIAQAVADHYLDYDGFVICHGTDTMAYTASTLSFMLEHLNKTVVLTGSQIPMSELRSDAVDNLLGSILVSGSFQIPEVLVYFDNMLLRGNRATKESSSRIDAFHSPNFEPLAVFNVNLKVDWHRVQKHSKGTFKLFTKMHTAISQITLAPFFNMDALEQVFKSSQAVILSCYGMGNMPIQNVKLMKMVQDAIDNDVLVVIKSQCHHGGVDDVYAAGRFLTKLGCILSQDMTTECLFAKLSYLLGKGYKTDRIRVLMKSSLRGELTNVSNDDRFNLTNNEMVIAIADHLKVTDNEDVRKISNTIAPVLMNCVASNGDLKLLKKLHKEGADLDAVDYLGRGIVHVIAHTLGSESLAQYLVHRKNINLNLLDAKARSALYLAIENENFKVAKIFADAGAMIEADEGRLAKMLCSVGHENKMVQLEFLVQCGVNLEQADYDKRTIAHLAAAEGHIDMLKYLIEHTNFDFSLKDRWGNEILCELKNEEDKNELKNLLNLRSQNAQNKKEEKQTSSGILSGDSVKNDLESN